MELRGGTGEGDLSLWQVLQSGVRPGRWYRASAVARSMSVERPAMLEFFWYDADGALLATNAAPAAVGSTWSDVALEARAPARAATAAIQLRHRGEGATAWDEVDLRELPLVQNFGPQAFKLRHRNGVFRGDRLYVISEKETNLGIIDLRTGRRVHLAAVDTSSSISSLAHSGGAIFFGVPGLARFNPSTHRLEHLRLPLRASRIEGMNEAPDGTIWGAAYPTGSVFSYHPETGKFRDYGQFEPGFKYGNGALFRNGKAIVGIGAPARLFVWDPATGERKQILPERFHEASQARGLAFHGGDRLFLRIDPGMGSLVLDANTFAEVAHIPSMGAVSPPDEAGRLYYASGGELRYYDLKRDATAAVASEHRFGSASVLGWVELNTPEFPGRSLAGLETGGYWWVWNPTTHAYKRVATDLPPAAYQTHTLHIGGDGNLWGVGYIGSGGFRLDAGDGYAAERFPAHQAEGMTAIGDTLYMGVYPSAHFYRQDIREPWNPEHLFSLGEIGQNRPFAALAHGGKYYIGTIPKRGLLGGAFAVYDPATGKHEAWRNLSPDQAIISIAVRGEYAYLGTSISGGLSSRPTTKEGKLLVFNLKTKEVETNLVPIPGELAVSALAFGPDGKLWGLTKGKLFVFDPAARAVVHTEVFDADARWASADHNWGVSESLFLSGDGYLYGSNGNGLFHVDPLARTVTVFYEGDRVMRPVEDPDGRIWFIGGDKKHLYRYNR